MAAGNVGINEWFASTSHSSLSSTIIEKGNFIDVLQMLPCWSKIDVSESEIEDLFRFISIASENPQYFTQKNLVDVFLDIAHIPVAINQSVIASDIIPDILQIIGKQSDSSSRIRDIFQDLDKDGDEIISSADLFQWISSIVNPEIPDNCNSTSLDIGKFSFAGSTSGSAADLEISPLLLEDESKGGTGTEFCGDGVNDFMAYLHVCGALQMNEELRHTSEVKGLNAINRLTFQTAYRRLRKDLVVTSCQKNCLSSNSASLVRRFFSLLADVRTNAEEFVSNVKSSGASFLEFAAFRRTVQKYEKELMSTSLSMSSFTDNELSDIRESFGTPLETSGMLKAYRMALLTEYRGYGEIESHLPLRTFARGLEDSTTLRGLSMVDLFDTICCTSSSEVTLQELQTKLVAFLNPISEAADTGERHKHVFRTHNEEKRISRRQRDASTPPIETVSDAALNWYSHQIQDMFYRNPSEIERRKDFLNEARSERTVSTELQNDTTSYHYELEDLMNEAAIDGPDIEHLRRMDNAIDKKIKNIKNILASDGPEDFIHSPNNKFTGPEKPIVELLSDEGKLFTSICKRWPESYDRAANQLDMIAKLFAADQARAARLQAEISSADELLDSLVDANKAKENYLAQMQTALDSNTGSLLRS